MEGRYNYRLSPKKEEPKPEPVQEPVQENNEMSLEEAISRLQEHQQL